MDFKKYTNTIPKPDEEWCRQYISQRTAVLDNTPLTVADRKEAMRRLHTSELEAAKQEQQEKRDAEEARILQRFRADCECERPIEGLPVTAMVVVHELAWELAKSREDRKGAAYGNYLKIADALEKIMDFVCATGEGAFAEMVRNNELDAQHCCAMSILSAAGIPLRHESGSGGDNGLLTLSERVRMLANKK